MQPRGKSKLLIDAMKADPEKALWTTEECAAAMCTESKAISAFLAGPMNQGWLFKHKLDSVRVAYSLQPPEDEEEEVPFSASLHDDGDLDLYGLLELETGGFRLSAEHVAKVRRMLTGEVAR